MNTHKTYPSLDSDSAWELALDSFSGLPHHDCRVIHRVIQMAQTRNNAPEKKFSQIFSTSADRKAGYRLIENESLAPECLSKSICDAGGKALSNQQLAMVVISQDTSWFAFPKCRNVEGMGKISDSRMKGFALHTALGISPDGVPLAILSMNYFVRPYKKPTMHRQARPIGEKESIRWEASAQNALDQVPIGTKAIFVSDRESDIYEYLDFLLRKEASFVVRVQHDRRVEGEEKYLLEKMANIPPLGRATMTIPKGHNRSERVVRMTLQTTEVEFAGRKGSPGKGPEREGKPLWVLRLVEDPNNEVSEPVEWILYTDMPVQTLRQGMEVLRLYTLRWRIEEFHLTLKSGMGVENQKFEGLEQILRWIYISAPMAVKLLELMLGSRESPNRLIEETVSPSEVEAIKLIIKRQTGRRPRRVTVEQAVKSIAFLGGWMGRRGDGPPGIRTFWRGWREMQIMAKTLETVSNVRRR